MLKKPIAPKVDNESSDYLVYKLLEITENNVEQLIHFKNELKQNNEKFDVISKTTSGLLTNVDTLLRKLDIMESHNFVAKINDLSTNSELKYKDFYEFNRQIIDLLKQVNENQVQFKAATLDYIESLRKVLSQLSEQHTHYPDFHKALQVLSDVNRTVSEIKDKDQFTRKLIIIFDGIIVIFVGIAAFIKFMT